jgi:hypothetical protein
VRSSRGAVSREHVTLSDQIPSFSAATGRLKGCRGLWLNRRTTLPPTPTPTFQTDGHHEPRPCSRQRGGRAAMTI